MIREDMALLEIDFEQMTWPCRAGIFLMSTLAGVLVLSLIHI